jgi:hypothetical protein
MGTKEWGGEARRRSETSWRFGEVGHPYRKDVAVESSSIFPSVSAEGASTRDRNLEARAEPKNRRVRRGRRVNEGLSLSGGCKSGEGQTNPLNIGGELQGTSSRAAEHVRPPLDGLVIGNRLIGERADPGREFLRPSEGWLPTGRGWDAPPALSGRSRESGPEAQAHGAIAESVSQSVKQFMEGLLEKVVLVAAHSIEPGVGHVVVLLFEAKELVGDAEALVSNGPIELHVPMFHLAPGVELEVGVGLGDVKEGDGPELIAFMAPGNGGALHGLALERKKDDEARPEEGAVIDADLLPVLEASRDPQEVAAILRRIGSRLGPDLWEMDQYREKPFITIYDERAGLGLWLTRPDDAGSPRRIVVEEDAETGRLIVRLVA